MLTHRECVVITVTKYVGTVVGTTTGNGVGVQGAKISQYKKDIAAKDQEIEDKGKKLKELEGKL
jgi:hypothetical protein